MRRALCAVAATLLMGGVASAGLTVEDTGGEPAKRVVTVTSPGVFKAEVWQASGGGINRFYNLATDPDAKTNLTREASGVLEIGWHCRGYAGPDREDCCPKHILKRSPRLKKDEKTGEMVRDACSDGCASWPSTNKMEIARLTKDPSVMGTLEVIEKSPVRVRIRAKAPFNWWAIWVHKLECATTYTFYPTGRIVAQVHITNPGDRTVHWSSEYGPHLMVAGDDKNPEGDLGFAWSTPTQETFKGGPSEELLLASSEKAKTSFLLSIPVEAHKVFSVWMRHNGRSIGWDRCGYGSPDIDMPPGYDGTWTCMIEMSAEGSGLTPAFKTAKEALPCAMQYREPAKITTGGQAFLPVIQHGGQTGMSGLLVTDDEGDLNADGFNESEGCHVLKGPGPLAFTFEKGKGAGFAPVFKVIGWAGDAPKTVKIDGKEVPVAAAIVGGKLILQVPGTVAGDRTTIEIH